ncbi:hypothetical protein [Ktedonosporobacter rubrisoli]|nr:hypothetical protein [Ktedonosporobacter rubrisoli]
MAFILDALTPALLKALSVRVAEARGEPTQADQPEAKELMETTGRDA